MHPEKLVLKIVGKTVILAIGEETIKKNLEKDEKDKLKKKIESYNKKPSEYWLTQIKNSLRTVVKPTKEKIEKKVKEKKVKEAKVEKANDKQRIKDLEATIELLKKENAEKDKQISESKDKLGGIVAGVAESADRLGGISEEASKKIESATDKVIPKATTGYRRSGEH